MRKHPVLLSCFDWRVWDPARRQIPSIQHFCDGNAGAWSRSLSPSLPPVVTRRYQSGSSSQVFHSQPREELRTSQRLFNQQLFVRPDYSLRYSSPLQKVDPQPRMLAPSCQPTFLRSITCKMLIASWSSAKHSLLSSVRASIERCGMSGQAILTLNDSLWSGLGCKTPAYFHLLHPCWPGPTKSSLSLVFSILSGIWDRNSVLLYYYVGHYPKPDEECQFNHVATL